MAFRDDNLAGGLITKTFNGNTFTKSSRLLMYDSYETVNAVLASHGGYCQVSQP